MRARADKKPSMDYPSESKSDVGDAAGHVPGGRSQVQMSACSMLRAFALRKIGSAEGT